jgi:hypothetical protein
MYYSKFLAVYCIFFCLAGGIILSSCHKAEVYEQALPPLELLESNYQLAELVCIAAVKNIEPQDTLFSDDGTPGYIRYIFHTVNVHTLKGDYAHETVLSFFTSAEYDENFISFWQRQTQLLVFLNRTSDLSGYYSIEAGVIPYTEQLAKKISGMFIEAENR